MSDTISIDASLPQRARRASRRAQEIEENKQERSQSKRSLIANKQTQLQSATRSVLIENRGDPLGLSQPSIYFNDNNASTNESKRKAVLSDWVMDEVIENPPKRKKPNTLDRSLKISTSSSPEHLTSDTKGAVATLAGHGPISTTAIQLVLASMEPVIGWKVYDPSYVNVHDSAKHEIKVTPTQCNVLVPLYHSGSGHWTVVYLNVTEKTVVYYDPLRSDVRWKIVEATFRELVKTIKDTPSNKEWAFRHDIKGPLQTNDVDCGILVLVYCVKLFHSVELPIKISPRFWRRLFLCLISPDKVVEFDDLFGTDIAHANKVSILTQKAKDHQVLEENIAAAEKSQSSLRDGAAKTLELCNTARKEGPQFDALRKLLPREYLPQKVNDLEEHVTRNAPRTKVTFSKMKLFLESAESYWSKVKDVISQDVQTLSDRNEVEQQRVRSEKEELQEIISLGF